MARARACEEIETMPAARRVATFVADVARGRLPKKLAKLKRPPDLASPDYVRGTVFTPWTREDPTDGFRTGGALPSHSTTGDASGEATDHVIRRVPLTANSTSSSSLTFENVLVA